MPDDRHSQLVSFIVNIDDAAGRAKHKHDKRHDVSASTVDLADPMKVELDTMLQEMVADKQPRRVGKATVGLEGVGSWARFRESGEGVQS